MGGHTLKTWSSSQSTISLSSGEAELYALTKCATQTVGLISIAKDFGMHLSAVVFTDSTAALGIVHREGLGRTRHIQCQYLWLQEKTKSKELRVDKVCTKINPADLLTKYLPAETSLDHMVRLKMYFADGKAGIGLTINNMNKPIKNDHWLESHVPDDTGARGSSGHHTRAHESSSAEGAQSNGGVWRRNHIKIRESLFTPMEVSKGPRTFRRSETCELL